MENKQTPVGSENATSIAEQDPGEVAAMVMNQLSSRYKQAIKDLPTGDVRRLALALATYPFEFEQVLDNNEKLTAAYIMGDRLIQAKLLLIGDFIVDAEKRREEVKQALKEQNEGEQENG